jgi:hypothetical protein
MPTVLMIDGFRLIIFSNDHPPAHVHVKQAEGGAKVSLNPVEITEYWKLNPRQLRRIEDIVSDNQDYLLEKWNELHGDDNE